MGPLSGDLRKRVVWAVCAEGMSCRASARRFGVSFSSAIGWVAALHERGSHAPLPMGGDTRSRRVEAHADFLLGLHRREPDLTLNEIRVRLERARGEKVSPSMIWRFFDRHDITFKKNPRTPASRTARTSLSGGGDGSRVNSTSIHLTSKPSSSRVSSQWKSRVKSQRKSTCSHPRASRTANHRPPCLTDRPSPKRQTAFFTVDEDARDRVKITPGASLAPRINSRPLITLLPERCP